MLVFDTKTRSGTYYAVTDRHALIVFGNRLPEIRSIWLGSIKTIEAKPNDRGHGSIKCYADYPQIFGKINGKGAEVKWPLFRGVANVESVYDLLEREITIQRAARDPDDDGIRLWLRSDIGGR